MKLDTKVTVFSITMSMVIVAVSFLSLRQFTISSEREHIRSIAGFVQVGLTELKINNAYKDLPNFLSRLAGVEGVKQVRVLRGPSVTKQFGAGLLREQAKDEIETRVLREGQAYFKIEDEGGGMVFRGTIPYIATRTGNPNCMQCHEETEGAVLGAITVSMSMSEMMRSAYATAAVLPSPVQAGTEHRA